ncbi:hypothetical protein CCAX7_16580 [Capsulimonas corticalis]|uniref:Uncharacterized protein n=1 Tax=Capsulimonas corticalis TaxID=2219043 RepID=A0A402CYV5_9BACT|nr:hypothetical protein [Capsulimonas corticalis]BDI29607.1 hypothetical protein CCAX7_16580 [Capsulimonas corticalis]
MQRKMISLLGAAGLMAMTTVAAVSQNNVGGNGAPPPPRAGHGRGVGGQVTDVDTKAGTISIASRWDETQTVKIGAGAKILARKDTTVGGLKVGDTIQVNGVFSQLTASSIQAGDLPDMPPPPMGAGRRGLGGPNNRRGPGGADAFGGPDMMGGPGAPGASGFMDGPGARGMRGGPGGPDAMDGGPGGPGGPGEDGPPPPDQGAEFGDQATPRIRGRHVASSARTIADEGPGQPGGPGGLDRDNRPGGPDDFDIAGAPPPPLAGRVGDDPMGDGPRGEMGMQDGPRGEGPMGGEMRGGPRGQGRMGGGPRGERLMGGPGGGGMGGHAHLSGKIVSLSPLTIAVSDSLSLVIKTDAKTHVTKIVSESLGDIKKGDRVFATGSFSSDVLNAKSVSVNLEP